MNGDPEEFSANLLRLTFEAKAGDTEAGVAALERMAETRKRSRQWGTPMDRAVLEAFTEIGTRVTGSISLLREAVQYGSDPITRMRWPVIDHLKDRARTALEEFADSPEMADRLTAEMQAEANQRIAGYQPTVDAKAQAVIDRYLRAGDPTPVANRRPVTRGSVSTNQGDPFTRRVLWALVLIPIAGFAAWQFATDPPGDAVKDGSYNCLTQKTYERKIMSEQQGVPMLYDPRPGRSWLAKVSDDRLTEVSRVDPQAERETFAEFYNITERIDRETFVATIQGRTFTCYTD